MAGPTARSGPKHFAAHLGDAEAKQIATVLGRVAEAADKAAVRETG